MKKRDFVTTGIPSIFTIFTVLVLVILSLMSYGTGRTDLEESRLSLAQTESYFEACEVATSIYAQGCKALAGLTGGELTASAEEYFSSLSGEEDPFPLTLSFDKEKGEATLSLRFLDRQSLELCLLLSEEEPALRLASWQCKQSGEWKAKPLTNLYDPSKGLP